MNCPNCGSRNITVADSNRNPDSELVVRLNGFKRRRACKDCGHRWTTFELQDTVLARFIELARKAEEEANADTEAE